MCGFLYGWTLLLVIQTGSIAALGISFSRYLWVLWPWVSESHYLVRPVHISSAYALSLSTAQFIALLERANFKRLSSNEINAALERASDWGINLEVDFDVFDRLEIFARGDVIGQRSRRRWRNHTGPRIDCDTNSNTDSNTNCHAHLYRFDWIVFDACNGTGLCKSRHQCARWLCPSRPEQILRSAIQGGPCHPAG